MSMISRTRVMELIAEALLKHGQMSQDKLVEYVVERISNGNDFRDFIKEIIRCMKEDKNMLIESLQGDLELVVRKRN